MTLVLTAKMLSAFFSGFAESGLEFRRRFKFAVSRRLSTNSNARAVYARAIGRRQRSRARANHQNRFGRPLVFSRRRRNDRARGIRSRPIPEDLREQYVKYRITIRMLGVLRKQSDGFVFAPTHRRMPPCRQQSRVSRRRGHALCRQRARRRGRRGNRMFGFRRFYLRSWAQEIPPGEMDANHVALRAAV